MLMTMLKGFEWKDCLVSLVVGRYFVEEHVDVAFAIQVAAVV